MASQHIYNAPLPAGVSVASTTTTLLQLVTPATRRAWIKEFSVSGRSTTSTDVPVLIYLAKQTTAGTSSATVTPQPVIESHPASLCTVNITFSAEPTTASVWTLGPWRVTPVGGLFALTIPLGDEAEVSVSSRIGLVVVTGQTSVIDGYIKYAE